MDCSSWIRPVATCWASSASPWSPPDENIKTYEVILFLGKCQDFVAIVRARVGAGYPSMVLSESWGSKKSDSD